VRVLKGWPNTCGPGREHDGDAARTQWVDQIPRNSYTLAVGFQIAPVDARLAAVGAAQKPAVRETHHHVEYRTAQALPIELCEVALDSLDHSSVEAAFGGAR
jgi:hypothetical protein